jgi:hypothetical protein
MIRSGSRPVGGLFGASDESGLTHFLVTSSGDVMTSQKQNMKTARPDLSDVTVDRLAGLSACLSRTPLLFTVNGSRKMASR